MGVRRSGGYPAHDDSYSSLAGSEEGGADHFFEEGPLCRICFDSTPITPLIAPCCCKGSQKYVHVHCLRKWQACVLEDKKYGEQMVEKAFRCSVCLTRFSLAPLVGPRPGCLLASSWGKALLALLAFMLVVVTGGGLPTAMCGAYVHMLLMGVLLLVCSRSSQPTLVVVLLLLLGSMGAMYSRGVRLVLRASQTTSHHSTPSSGGSPSLGLTSWQLALIRSRPPVSSPLHAGALLVASPKLDHTDFSRSVILLLNYTAPHGAQGVVLSHPEGEGYTIPLGSRKNTTAASSQQQQHQQQLNLFPRKLVIRHHVGGPLGSPPTVFTDMMEEAQRHSKPAACAASSSMTRQQQHSRPAAAAAQQASSGSTASQKAQSAPQHVVVLHNVPGIPGARPVLHQATVHRLHSSCKGQEDCACTPGTGHTSTADGGTVTAKAEQQQQPQWQQQQVVEQAGGADALAGGGLGKDVAAGAGVPRPAVSFKQPDAASGQVPRHVGWVPPAAAAAGGGGRLGSKGRGLASSSMDSVAAGSAATGGYPPAFGQMVVGGTLSQVLHQFYHLHVRARMHSPVVAQSPDVTEDAGSGTGSDRSRGVPGSMPEPGLRDMQHLHTRQAGCCLNDNSIITTTRRMSSAASITTTTTTTGRTSTHSSGAGGIDEPEKRSRDDAAALPTEVALLVFNGYAGWKAGQLEEEISSGAWAVVDATTEDMRQAVSAPGTLWSSLIQSDRLHWQ